MGKHVVPETEVGLAELVDLAIAGEEVVITRDGTPVAEMRAVPALERSGGRPMTAAEIERMALRLRGRGVPLEDAGTLVSRMRDEDWR